MTLRLRVSNGDTGRIVADTFASSAEVTFGLNKSISWSANFPVVTEAVALIATGLQVEIFYNGVSINSGEIQDFTQEYTGVDGFLKLKGRSDLDLLFDSASDPLTAYEGEYLIDALYCILSKKGWKIGEITTWEEPYRVISNDLSNSKTTVEQIKKLLKDADTNLFYRKGEDLFGSPTLDIGLFNESSGVRFIMPPAGEDRLDKVLPEVNRIKSLKVETKSTDIIGSLVVHGGTYTSGGVESRLSLREYLSQDYTRWQDSEFPIVETIPFVEYTMFNKTLDPYPGGIIRPAFPLGTTVNEYQTIGDFGSGATSTVSAISFWGIGGRLSKLKLGIGHVGGISDSFQEANIDFEFCEILDPSSPYDLTTGNLTILYATTIPASNPFVIDSVWEFDFPQDDDNLITEFGKRYCFRIGAGYVNIGDGNFDIRPRGVDDTIGILDQGLRWDWNSNQFSSLNSDRRYLMLSQIEFNPIDSPGYPSIKQTYDQYAPESDGGNNDSAEINASADALELRARAALRDRATVRQDWSMSAIGTNLVVPPGDTVFVQGTAEKVVANPASSDVNISRFQVAKNLRVDEVALKFSKDSFVANYKLFEGDGVTEEEAFISVYDETKYEPKEKGLYYEDMFKADEQTSTLAYNHIESGSSPDTTMSDGRKAKLLTLRWEKPSGTTRVHKAELMAKPFQLPESYRLDSVDLELINSVADSIVSETLSVDVFKDVRDGGASVYSLITDNNNVTGWNNSIISFPHVSNWELSDDKYNWVLTEVEQQTFSGSTTRRYLPGSFTIWGSNTGAFAGEEVQIHDEVNITIPAASEIRTYAIDNSLPYKYYQQRTTFTFISTDIGYVEMWMKGYRVIKAPYMDNYDIELVTDIDNTNEVGVIIKVAPKKRDWSLLDTGSFGAYYYWR